VTERQDRTGLPLGSGQIRASAGGERKAARAGRRVASFALVIIAIASVAGPTLWAGYLSVKLLWAPVSLPQAHDYEAALSQVFELQRLAISEAEAGEQAFFTAHVGCAAPPVWQDERVLENFKRMVLDLGVEVKLLTGLTSSKGNPLLSPNWPYELEAKLKDHGVTGIVHKLPKELWNYSIVAGSKRRSQAYITSHEEMDIYPTTYITVHDNESCQEWKNYLMNVPLLQNPTSRPL